jgi:D-methionine transport system ATP-binding protein
MIQIEHLNKTYVSRQGETHTALTDINLTIEDGSVFGIIGQSGAGKSTLVRCLNLLERPTSGSIIINGRDITSLSEKELREFRSSVSMVFQNFSLLQQRTVLRNVMFPLELRHADKKEAEKRARELLELVGLADKCDKYPSQLSGGQQQRVAIARALVNNPSIMLCDEATSALDSMTTHSILKLLKDINEKMGVTIVLITHSLAVAELICDNVVVIDEGKIVEEGKTEDIFANPQSDVARKLLEKRL